MVDVKDERHARPGAVLVGVQLPGVDDIEHKASLAELGRLVHTLGLQVVATLSQKRAALAAGTVVGEGKLREMARLTGGSGVVPAGAQHKKSKAAERWAEEEAEAQPDESVDADDETDEGVTEPDTKAKFVVFDNDLTPRQLSNLEAALGAEVLDRTGVIVEIFHRHAKTREARMQVEIARLSYLAPRLRATGPGERQGGGIGAKGVGETAHELDRRRIRDRIAELRRELETIHKDQSLRRARRREALRVALVGYTNAGKSSLMRALTGSDVLIADKLFATLDTTVRTLHPETRPRILISDTVGFIKKLPHDLVASFRSTLDEALDASLLLFVVDASDATFRSQMAVTRTVLNEIGAQDVPSFLVLNKCDALTAEAQAVLRAEFPEAILMATVRPDDVAALRERLVAFFEDGMEEAEIHLSYAQSSALGELRAQLRVLSEDYSENGVLLKVRAFPETLGRLRQLAARPSDQE